MDYQSLSAAFPGKVFFPDSPEYNNSIVSYWAAFEKELSPSCIIMPTSAEDVSNVIKVVSEPALKGHFQLAIRGGGHTAWAGAANIDMGITLDLRYLTGINVDGETKICSIGAGERWGKVYSTLGAQGLAVAGGRVSKVGVAGLITGGGLSYFSAASGFVCDNVVNFEIVLASSEIVQANSTTNSDLFLALKGGSNNFGIVTRFDLPSFPQGRMWGGAIFYDSSTVPQLIQAFCDFAASPIPDDQAHLFATTSFSAGREVGVSNIFHSTPVVAPPSLKPFTEINPQLFNTLRTDTLLGFAEETSAFSTDGDRQWYFTTTLRPDPNLILQVRALWLEGLKPIENLPGLKHSLVLQPLTHGMLTKSAALGGNSLGLSPEDGPLAIILFATVHDNPEDDETIVTSVLDLIDLIDSAATKAQKAARFRFTNYGYKSQKIIEGYGSDSLKKLQDVSTKYDPQGLFQIAVPGGFKLPKT